MLSCTIVKTCIYKPKTSSFSRITRKKKKHPQDESPCFYVSKTCLTSFAPLHGCSTAWDILRVSHIRCKTKHPHQDRKVVSKLVATFCRLTRTRHTHTHTHTHTTHTIHIKTEHPNNLKDRTGTSEKGKNPTFAGHSDQTKKLYRQSSSGKKTKGKWQAVFLERTSWSECLQIKDGTKIVSSSSQNAKVPIGTKFQGFLSLLLWQRHPSLCE